MPRQVSDDEIIYDESISDEELDELEEISDRLYDKYKSERVNMSKWEEEFIRDMYRLEKDVLTRKQIYWIRKLEEKYL